jgi:hypothetical protein
VYTAVIFLHSLLRWVVLGLALAASVLALRGRLGSRPFTRTEERTGLFFVAAIDTQVLLGLLLYFALSPMMRVIRADFGGAMHNPLLRFWAVEHLTAGVLALAFAHVGRARSRRASTDAAKHGRAALWYTLALLMLLVAIPWSFLPYGRPLLHV